MSSLWKEYFAILPSSVQNDLLASFNQDYKYTHTFNDNIGWIFLIPNNEFQSWNSSILLLYTGYHGYPSLHTRLDIVYNRFTKKFVFSNYENTLYENKDWSKVERFAKDYLLAPLFQE